LFAGQLADTTPAAEFETCVRISAPSDALSRESTSAKFWLTSAARAGVPGWNVTGTSADATAANCRVTNAVKNTETFMSYAPMRFEIE
jgi:hypothetical protein